MNLMSSDSISNTHAPKREFSLSCANDINYLQCKGKQMIVLC